MMDDELILQAKLASLAGTDEARLIRALLIRLNAASVIGNVDSCPPCNCELSAIEGLHNHAHALSCNSRTTYRRHVDRANLEWGRSQELVKSLRTLFDAVASEVAMHPGMHDQLNTAFQLAKTCLMLRESSDFPGDDRDLPF